MAEATLRRWLPDEAATSLAAQDIALALRPGDVVALSGDLGAGKTTLARAIIRLLAGNADLDVPSPTFTLLQTYDGRVPIAHFDLYRLGDASELDELGFDEERQDKAVLVEWPERASGRMPAGTVHVRLDTRDAGRDLTLTGTGQALARLTRSFRIRDFLADTGRAQAERTHFVGDASARSYELIHSAGEPVRVLANAPALVLGPPVKDGLAYAEIANTSRDIRAFVAVDRMLAERGFSVPSVLAADYDHGLMLLDHLGDGSFLSDDGEPVLDRYKAAAELLATLHAKPWSGAIDLGEAGSYQVPPFDRGVFMIEASLMISWYVEHATGRPADAKLVEAFESAWSRMADRVESAERSLVLRDIQWPNLIWRGERQGPERIGLLDFQDALIGPSAYDVASLAQDARVTLPPAFQDAIVDAYVAARRAHGPFDEAAFHEAFAIMAAQRHTKILGIFVRLKVRDGKPGYLGLLPRIRAYLRRTLQHPALAPVAEVYERHHLLDEPT